MVWWRGLLGLGLGILCSSAFAEDLLSVYRQALQEDPDFHLAKSTFMAEREAEVFAKATLMPNVDFDASLIHKRTRYHSSTPRLLSTIYAYGVSLSQPVYNAAAWANLKGARAHVKAAYAQYLAAQQSLIWRVANAYVNVLVAEMNLRTAHAKRRTATLVLDKALARYQQGKVTKTAVKQVKSVFDEVVSEILTDEKAVTQTREALFRITGKQYQDLPSLPVEVIKSYQVAPESEWVKLAMNYNYSLRAARFYKQEAKSSQRAALVNRYPVVSASADYDWKNTRRTRGTGSITSMPQVGVGMSVPLYHGGELAAQQRQASWQLVGARASLLAAKRQAESATRQAYQEIAIGLNKITADKQALMSKRLAWDAVKTAYHADQRSLHVTLEAQDEWFLAKKILVRDFYRYVMATLTLKREVGQLSDQDLQVLNDRLHEDKEDLPDDFDVDTPSSKLVERLVSVDELIANPSALQFYAIQLAAFKSEQAAVAYLREHDLASSAYVEQELDQYGKQHTVVLFGHYDSHGEAEEALKHLPKRLDAGAAWVRCRGAHCASKTP